ncbi:MAG: hypothetical protein J0M30_14690 [Chitinophagales bacterium]|nr:hypothetical protein [Chitinophagales bacterium]
MRIVYIAHPVGGNVEANLAAVRAIINRINTDPKFEDVVPFVPWYSDVVSCDDSVPELRERGLRNDEAIIKKSRHCRYISEMWLFGPRISEGMKREIHAALEAQIPVSGMTEQLRKELALISEEYFQKIAIRG